MFLGALSLIVGTFTAFGTNTIYAQDLELIGKELGLEVTPNATKLFDLSNLNPGDTKDAKIDIKNIRNVAFNLSMRTERMSDLPEPGEVDLFQQLIITVYLDGVEIYTGPMKDFATGNIALGEFDPNDEKELKALVHLPGPGTGNEFQGSSLDVKWIFIATAEAPVIPIDPDPDPTPDPTPNPTPDPTPVTIPDPEPEPEEIEIIEDPIPEAVPEMPEEEDVQELEEIEISEEEIPLAAPKLPKTGDIPSAIYYALGTILLGLGIGTRQKK